MFNAIICCLIKSLMFSGLLYKGYSEITSSRLYKEKASFEVEENKL